MTADLQAAVGDLCDVERGEERQLAEVIGFDRGLAQILPYEPTSGLQVGARVLRRGQPVALPCDDRVLGRVLDGLGRPVDGRGPVRAVRWTDGMVASPDPLLRPKIAEPFVTRQRAIDGLLTCGVGQRVGLFAGSGVGKSTLLGEIAKYAHSDVNVIALIGERGREVRPFLEECLGTQGMRRSVAVVATADESPLMRTRAAETAVAIADGFRRQGQRVLFLLDSMTRVAAAQREIGLQLGEPPSSRGYTPSVFQRMSALLECLGATEHGTITALVTVLVEGDDMDEPIADSVRSTVDGHIVLSRRHAHRGHYPAIDIAQSISRVFRDVTSGEHQIAAQKIRQILATYDSMEQMIRIGAYQNGESPEVDAAIRLMPAVNMLLRQQVGEVTEMDDTVSAMQRIAAAWPFE